MNSWEWIFRQSRVNDGEYDGERLGVQNWNWPRDTWLQKRLRYLRRANTRHSRGSSEETISSYPHRYTDEGMFERLSKFF